MKITIELSDAEVRAIKGYLKEVDLTQHPKKADIKKEIEGIVYGNLRSGALGDFVDQEEANEIPAEMYRSRM